MWIYYIMFSSQGHRKKPVPTKSHNRSLRKNPKPTEEKKQREQMKKQKYLYPINN
jgi:hypothetical protein